AATRDFNDDLRPVVTAAMLADLKKEFDQKAGVFLSVKEVHQLREEGSRAIELIAQFSKAPVSMVIVFDELDRIASIHANPIGPEPALESAARALLANFVAGHFDDVEKAFDDTMRKQLPVAAMSQLAASVGETFGTYQGVNDVKQRANPPYRVIDITVAYTKRTAAFHVAFDPQNRVSALQIAPVPNQP
ncbi:MAG: DUF3887 domain-containing protein, partial [Thermoanaerobaculia bacterium]